MEYAIRPAWRKVAILAGAGMVAAGIACADPVDPETLKLSYLWNFPKFVEWPAGVPAKGSNFNICIIGDEMVNAAKDFLKGRKLSNNDIAVLNGKRTALDTCQVVFISASESLRVPTVLSEIAQRPILTISDTEHFARDGGAIGLVPRDQKLGFEINLGCAEAAGLKVRATLSELAVKRY